MTSIRKISFALGLATALGATPVLADSVKITFLGVGDIYKFDGSKQRGGPARLNAVARAERAANPNTVYVMDGDMLSPSLMSGFDKGANMIALTNIMPFDLAVPGNHEFDAGVENFAAQVKASKYPWAAINITTPEGKAPEGLGGVMMKDVAGVKVALVPVAQDSTPEESSSGNLKFSDSVKAAIDAAKQARKDGADLVVGVVQAPHSQDQQMIAAKVFDLILSGDDHDLVVSYDGITAFVETSTEANYLVPVDVTVNVETKDGKRNVSWQPSFRFIDTANVQPDPESQKLVDQYSKELDDQLNVVIGKTESALDSRRNVVRTQESAIGNLVADALREATKADIAITNGGGIRGDKQYAAGQDITRRDILTELPFGNMTVSTLVTGKQVWDALENGFSHVEDGAGRFPQVSGMVVTADKSKPAGSRLVSVMIGDKPLDPNASYKLATNDFMLKGGDGYTALTAGKPIVGAEAGKLMANDVLVYVKAHSGVQAKLEGRVVVK